MQNQGKIRPRSVWYCFLKKQRVMISLLWVKESEKCSFVEACSWLCKEYNIEIGNNIPVYTIGNYQNTIITGGVDTVDSQTIIVTYGMIFSIPPTANITISSITIAIATCVVVIQKVWPISS